MFRSVSIGLHYLLDHVFLPLHRKAKAITSECDQIKSRPLDIYFGNITYAVTLTLRV